MDVRPQPETQIRDIRAKRQRLKKLEEAIPEMERKLVNAIHEKASIEAVIVKVEAHELAKNHDGLCGEVDPACDECLDTDKDCTPNHEACKRFYDHTGKHSWEGGGIG